MNNFNSLHVKIASTLDECVSYVHQWDEFLQSSGTASLFCSFEWVKKWWESFGKEKSLVVIFILDDDYLIGIAPFVLYRGDRTILYQKKIEMIGCDLADYPSLLIREGREQDVCELIIKTLFEMENSYDFIKFNISYFSENLLSIIDNIFKKNRYTFLKCQQDLLKIDTQGKFQEYFMGLSQNLKNQISRKKKALAKLGFCRLKVANNKNDIEYYLKLFYLFYNKRALRKKQYYLFLDENILQFYERFSETIFSKGWLHLSVLFVNEKPISLHLGFIFKERFYWYAPVFDEDLRKYSPGVVHLFYLIEYSFLSGIKEFDFLRGNERYKYRWADQSNQIFSYFISGKSFKKKLFFYLIRLKDFLFWKMHFSYLANRLKFHVRRSY